MAVTHPRTQDPAARRLPARVALRARAAADGPDLFDLFSERGILDHALMREPFASAEELTDWLDGLNATRRFEIVAVHDGRCVGFGAMYVQGEHFNHCGAITLGVREPFRGRGIGGLLLRALLATAQLSAGLAKVQLTVLTDNAAAIRLYNKHGFQFEGLHRRFARRGGRFVDAYSMAALLEPPKAAKPRRGV